MSWPPDHSLKTNFCSRLNLVDDPCTTWSMFDCVSLMMLCTVPVSTEPDSSGKRSSRVAAVCLGLLCVLLAGIIGLSVLLYSVITLLEQTCPAEWQKFESSWYLLSTGTKTWKESRADCLEREADLVIINSNKEQEFLFKLNKRVWIGLTDSVTEGTWIWVDGTTLTTPRYWYDPQPDNAGPTGEENCVEIRTDQSLLEAWNDISCDSKLNWICEKVV
uniref:C-type lectin domain-containing protein n=1 Tax=Hucho hucho TaxID=62062 RepID=A0A4W5R1Z7_9TELE